MVTVVGGIISVVVTAGACIEVVIMIVVGGDVSVTVLG